MGPECLGARLCGPKLAVLFNRTGPDYFRTMSIPFVAGRDFDRYDDLAAPKVAIVNEQFARKMRSKKFESAPGALV